MRIGRAEIKLRRRPIIIPNQSPLQLPLGPIGVRDLSTWRMGNDRFFFFWGVRHFFSWALGGVNKRGWTLNVLDLE
jgi:hypothetical protein